MTCAVHRRDPQAAVASLLNDARLTRLDPKALYDQVAKVARLPMPT
jgi:hypothetical protein